MEVNKEQIKEKIHQQVWGKFEGTDLSMWLWSLCCAKYGVGGTPKALKMYEDVKEFIINYKT